MQTKQNQKLEPKQKIVFDYKTLIATKQIYFH